MTAKPRTVSRETIERLLDTGADIAQALRDLAGDHDLEAAFAEPLDAWETAYHTAEAELCAPVEHHGRAS